MPDPDDDRRLTGLLIAGRRGHDPAVATAIAERLRTVCVDVYAGPGVQAAGTAALTLPGSDRGRLAVIIAALERAPSALLAVVAADLKDADADVLTLLAARWQGEAAVVPVVDGRVRPLHGVYATAGAARLRATLEAGTRSVVHALSAVGASVVGEEAWGGLGADGTFAMTAG